MRAIAEELVGAAVARREVDLVEALTYPLPVVVIAEIIGIPAEDRAQFKEWSDVAVENLGAVFMGPLPPERIARQRQVRMAMEEYFRGLVDERRRQPREDLLSGLVAAELEGSRLTFDELLAMLDDMLEETGGPLTPAETRKIDRDLGLTRRRRTKR